MISFIAGVFLGMGVCWWVAKKIFDEQNECIARWHRRAMEYLELWQKETEKRRDKDDADWWKK